MGFLELADIHAGILKIFLFFKSFLKTWRRCQHEANLAGKGDLLRAEGAKGGSKGAF